MKKVKTPFAVRLDPDHLRIIKKKNIKLGEKIQEFVKDLASSDKCPTCGQKLKE